MLAARRLASIVLPRSRSVGSESRTYGTVAALLLLAPLSLLLLAVFFYPIASLLRLSLFDPGFTLVHYQRLVEEPLYLTILVRTLRVALICTVAALVLGYPLAYAMARLRGTWATVFAALVVLPLWTSVLVRSYAWTVLFQRNGLINNGLAGLGLIDEPLEILYTELAVIIAMTHVLLPFMVLPLYSVLRSIPKDLSLAARSLGATAPTVFRRVTFPLSLPGVGAGVLIVFILALGFYITPALVGGPRTLMIATLIGQQTTELLNWGFAGALSATLLVVTLVIVLGFNRWLRLGRVVGETL